MYIQQLYIHMNRRFPLVTYNRTQPALYPPSICTQTWISVYIYMMGDLHCLCLQPIRALNKHKTKQLVSATSICDCSFTFTSYFCISFYIIFSWLCSVTRLGFVNAKEIFDANKMIQSAMRIGNIHAKENKLKIWPVKTLHCYGQQLTLIC